MLKKSVFTVLLVVLSHAMSVSCFAHGFNSPEEALNTYIKAVTTGSAEHVEMAFTESASIQYYDDKGQFQNYSRDDFGKLVGTGNKWNAQVEISDLKVTGKVANATVEFTWGDNSQHGYVDYLNLVHDGKSWHITDKVAQYIKR